MSHFTLVVIYPGPSPRLPPSRSGNIDNFNRGDRGLQLKSASSLAEGAAAAGEDLVDLHAKPYYFGCEADDRMNATAFGHNNPFGSKLNAIFSSDIGHFDVIDMRHPLPEAYELVEDGHITADNFRDFTFANAVKLWGTQNPKFSEGTRGAKEAAAVLAAAQTPTLAAAE